MMKLSIYSDLIDFSGKTLGVNYFTREICLFDEKKDKILSGHHHIRNSTIFSDLSPNQEFNNFKKWFKHQSRDMSSFDIIWIITTECNFRCIYCYEEGYIINRRHIKPDLILQELELFLNKLHKLYKTEECNIYFYGGEPSLLGDDFPKIIHALRKCNLKVKFGMFTNGYHFSEELIKCIKENLFYLQITIDGNEVYHNKFRPLKNGKGTFNRILQNIIAMLDMKINILLVMNFNKDNILGIKSFLSNNRFLANYETLQINFAPIFITAYKERILGKRESWDLIGDKLKELIIYAYQLGYNVDLLPKLKRGLCAYYKLSSLLIDNEGNVFKCIGTSGRPDLKISTLNYLTSTVAEYMDILEGKTVVPFLQDNKCHLCKYLPVCLGGCRFHSIEENNSSERRYCFDEFIQNSEIPLIKFYSSNQLNR